MADEILLPVKIDLASARHELEDFKQAFEGLKQTIDQAPNATNAFSQGLERAVDTADLLLQKLNRAQQQTGLDEDNVFVQDIQAGLKELSSLKDLFSDGGVFSTSLAKNMFSGLSEAARHELDASTAAIATMIRTKISTLKSTTLAGLSSEIMKSADAQSIFKDFKSVDSKDFRNYIQSLLPHVAPTYALSDYRKLRYGTDRKSSANSRPIDIIPSSFRQSFKNGGYIQDTTEHSGYMQPFFRTKLRDLVSENDAAMRAARATSGMITHDSSGRTMFAHNITAKMYDEFRQNLFNDFINRASGRQSERINPFKELTQEEERRLLGRMTSSSAGRVLSAMGALETINGDRVWGGSSLGSGFQRLEKEVKQSLEQYEVAKYRFDDLFGGKDKHSNVTIAESQNTRLLGLQGKHNQFTDKVILVSANGYDRSDANQRNFMDRLLSGQAVNIPGSDKKYIMQNLHGTGEHSVIRMVEQQAYEEVRKREEQWAKEHGFTGTNYWNDFVDAAFDFEDIKSLRKHYDATGKGWTPSQQLYSNFQNKKFGVVDLSRLSGDVKQKLADGLGWFADGILPINDIQGRMGVSGKGTFHTLKGYKTLGEFAAAAGLLNDQGRFILPGPRGDIDLTDYSGMTDISTLKNVQAYANFATPEAYNEGFTAMLQRYGMSSVQDYDSAKTRGRGLGAQAMAYIKLSPEMQNAQINEYMRRMRLLDTEAGIREYLLGDPDNYLGAQVRNGAVSVGDRIVQNWVQAERESLIERMASGEWIDFGEQPSVINQKVNKSPIASLIQMGIGKTREEVLNKIKQKYNLTDDEVEGIFALNKGQIVDFARPEERDISVQRSPNGFGNFVYGRNYADIARRVYNDHGLSTSGVYLSEADMLKLGDADFDGDAVKTLYGDIGKAFKEAAIMHDKAMASLGEVVDPITTPVKLDGINNYIDSTQHKRLALEANMDSGLAMGSSSSSGIRSTQFDLYNPANRDYLIAAIQSNPAYAATSAQAKNATETQITPEMRKALYEGAQWSKLPTRFSRFFNVTGNDDIDKPSIEDIFETDINNKKEKVNLAELRDVGLDSINFRSIFSGADLGGARAAFEASKNGVDMTRAYALLQALDKGIGYGDAGENTVQLMKTLRQMKVQDIMNPGRILTREEVGKLEEMINAASDEIDRQYFNQGSSVVMKKKNEFGVTAARNFIERGIHESNLSAYFGDGWKELFPEFYATDREGVNIPGNESYKKFDVYEDAEQRLKENNARLGVIDREIKQREEKIQKIKDKLPEADRDKFDETLTKEEAVDVAKRIAASTGADTKRVEAEAKEIERIYSDAEAFASEYGLDPNQVAMDLQQLREERSQKVAENMDLGKAYDFIKQQEKFYSARSMLKEFTSGLFSSKNSKEAKLDNKPISDSYYDKQMMLAKVFLNPYKILQRDESAYRQLSQDEKDEITTALSPDRGVIANVKREFADTAAIRAKNLFEKFDAQNAKHAEPEEILKRRFDQYDELLQGVIEYRDKLVGIIDTEKNDDVKNDLQKRLKQANDYIKQAQEQIDHVKQSDAYNIQENMRRNIAQADIRNLQQEYSAERFETQSDQMLRNWNARGLTDPFSRSILQRETMYNQFKNERNTSELNLMQARERLNQAQSMLNNPQATSQQKLIAQKDIDSATASIEHYNKALANAQAGMKQFESKDGQYSKGWNALKGSIDAVSQSADRLIQRFGRQTLQKAFQEAKNFTVQFDSQMRSIQAITMKTDEQMQAVKKATIDRAIELKTSVANVAQVEADLYRQGLNDQQVDERSEAIIKFSTVTGAKITDAGKAITTAIQNDLVGSATEAMDVLTALGDNAATTANEIFKGMQKSAAAAKIAGVSYKELTTMLTIGTSKTQLSGQVLGTGLQTIFSRMNRVTNKGYVDNETGAATTINDVEKALQSAGIKLRTEDGKSFRNSFEVLRDLSSVWNTLSDLQRSNITYTMAGGRQQNIFQSLMEGMSEDNGSELARLLGLAENSSGSTENKYEIAIRSITASLEELKATYDGLVAAVDGNGFFIGALDTVTDFVGGLKNFVGTAPSVVTGFTIIGTAIAAFIVKLAASKALMDTMSSNAVGLISTLAGIAVAGTVLAGAGAIGTARQDWLNSNDENKQYEEKIERAKEFYETQKKRIEPIEGQVDNVEKLGEAWEKAGKKMDGSEATALQNALSGLEQTLSSLTGNFERNSAAIKDWRAVAEEGRKSAEAIEYEAAERADNIADDYALKQANEMYEEYISRQKAVTQSFDIESFIGKLSTSSIQNEDLARIVNGIAEEDLAEEAELYGFSNFNGTNQDLLSLILKSRVMQALISGDFAKYKINDSSEEIKQIKEIYDAYKATDDYSGALAGLGLDQIKPNPNKKPWETEATPIEDYEKYDKLFDRMISYKDKYIDKDYGSEAYAENTKNFIRGSLRNSSILNHLFGGNAEVLNNIIEKELEGLTFKNLSGEQINNKIKDIRTGIYNQYNGKSKEWLDTIINPQNYEAQISYVTPEGKKITFGTNDLKEDSAAAAELLAQEHYEQGNQQTELQANTSAVTSATGAIEAATGVLADLKKDESSKTEEEEHAETKVEVNIATDKNGNIESVSTNSSELNRTGNAFVAPKGSWKVAGTGTARPPREESGITSTGNLLEDMQSDLQRIKEARKKTAEIQQKIDEAQQQIDDKFSIEDEIQEALKIRKNNKAYGLLNGYNKLLSIAEEAGISKDELEKAGFNIDVMQNRRVDSTGFDVLISYIRNYEKNKDNEEEEEASFWEPKESVMRELQKKLKEEDTEEESSFFDSSEDVAREIIQREEAKAFTGTEAPATGHQIEYEANEKFVREFSKELNDKEEEASFWEPKESVAKELEGIAEEESFFDAKQGVRQEIYQRAEAAVAALTEPLFTGLEALATGHQVAFENSKLEKDTEDALAEIKRKQEIAYELNQAEEETYFNQPMENMTPKQPWSEKQVRQALGIENYKTESIFVKREAEKARIELLKQAGKTLGVEDKFESALVKRVSDKTKNELMNRIINKSDSANNNNTVSLEGFKYVPTDLKKLVGDAAANAKNQDLTGLYNDMLNIANTVSSFEELNKIVGTGDNAKRYAPLINGDETLRKIFEDMANGGTKYTWNDVLEQLQSSGLGTTLGQLIPAVSSGAYNYNRQSAALAAFKNNTATSAQYDMIAQQYGIDRNTLISNIDLYRSLEDQRLNLERGKLEQSASNYFGEMMKPFIESVGELDLKDYFDDNRFETVWNRYLENADNKERLQSLMQSYTTAGYEFKMDSNGKISTTYKGEPLKEEDALNPYAWNRSVSREQIRKDIDSYLRTGDITAGPEKDKRIEAMKSYSSALSEYINMTDDARNSLDGLRLLEQARLQYLEEEKTVIGSLANTMEQISKSNALDSFKAANDLLSQLTEMSNAGAAFNRLKGQMSSNQKTSEADWQTVANYLNLTPKQLQDYQSGKRQLSSLNVQFATSDELVNNSIAEYVQARVMEAAEASNMTYRPSELVLGKGARGMVVPGKERMSFEEFVRAYPEDAKKLIEEYGAEYGASYENGQWTFADLSDEQYGIAETARMAEARYNMIKEMANSTDDYRKAYNLAKAAGGNFEAFEFRADKFGNFTTDEIKNLVGADEYLKLKDAGDTQGLLALLFNKAFGGEMSQYRLADTSRYIDMLLNGNVADLTKIFDQNSVLRDYIFQNVEGFERAYLDRVSGKQLEQYQIDALKSTKGYNELYELERNKVYRKGTAELASTLITGTDRERTQAIYEQGEERRKYEETSQAIGQILQDTEANNGLYWQKIQENGLLNDEQIKHYKEHVDELKDAQADIDKELSGIDEGLKAALATAFNLGNLDELAEPGHEEILAAVRKLLNVSGLELEVGENGVNIGRDNRSPWEILTSVADLGEYGAGKTIRDQQNKFVRAIMESSNIEEFESTFNKLFAGLSEDNIQKIIGTDWQTMLAEMMSGDYSWEEMQNKFTQSSRYAPFYKDLSFEKNYEKAQGYFGENFGYSSEVNQLSKEQIDQIINDDGLVNWIKNIDGGTEVLRELASAGKVSSETIKKFNANFASARIKDVKQWGDNTDEVAENVAKLRRNSKSANEALRGMATQMTSISKNQFYRDRYRKGDRSKETLNAISGMTGLSEDLVKQGGKLVDQMLKGSESDELKSVQTWADTVSQMINDELKGKISNLDLTLDQMQILATEGSVNIDFSDVANKVDADVRAQMQAMIAMLEQNGFKYHLQAEGDGESGTVKLVIDGLGSGRGGGGRGGGGGGKKKSKAEELLEKQKREQAQRSHEIKMIQYQETKYENAGELSNQNRMLELENKAQERYVKTLQKNIAETKKQLAQTKKGTDDWKNLYDAILGYEEAIEEANIAIGENTKKIKENKQAIYQMRSELEQAVLTEIENRKQTERNMLEGSVSMQDIVLEAIRQRYRDEWELIEKDVEKKKEALEEEKNLIDERLQRRKDAEDEAEKYEELAEYKKQLALIEMDSTRTKDAAKLRAQIADLEKDISWGIAEDEANYQKETIDDQIQAYEDFITYGSEDLEDYLEDANNFADEVNEVMQKSQKGLIKWLKNNVKEYALSLDSTQKQMIQGWTDTYEQMLNITHTYWDEIAEILSGKNTFLKYMKASQEYKDASAAERKQMVYEWSEMYDNYIAAQKKDAVYSHNDSDVNKLGQNTNKSSSGGGGGSNKTKEPEQEQEQSPDQKPKENIVFTVNEPKNPGDSSEPTANDNAIGKLADSIGNFATQVFNTIKQVVVGTPVNQAGKTGAEVVDRKTGKTISAFASGGLVDYTGPAWVDGTPTKPEAFLDAEDTALMRDWLDSARYVKYRSSVSNIDSSAFTGNSQNIGELIINITEAQFKDDADFDEVANKVGDRFVKELSKQGFNMLSYSF